MKHFTILIFFISISCFSQIAIERPDKESENTEPLKPTFEQEIDLNEYKTAEQFLGLIGNELLLLPVNSKYDFASDRFESISYLPKEKIKLNKVKYKANTLVKLSRYNKELIDYLKIQGNYFVVDSIQFYDGSYSFSKKVSDREFNKKQAEYSSIFSGSVDIYTHHKESNEIIIFNISNDYDADKLISVSYFNHLTEKFLDKKVIVKKRGFKNYRENDGISNYDRKFLDSTQIFEITKIVLTEPKTEYHKYYTPVFNLKSLENNIEEIEYYKIKDDLIFLEDFNVGANLKEKEDAIKADSIEKERVLEEKLLKEQRELQLVKNEKIRSERLAKFIKKYGGDYGETIANNKVRIGMTKLMCEDSWGKPDSVNRTTNSYGTSEQWVYDGGSYLYFDNNKLTSIQN
jgi:hypothetical protein